MARFYNITIDKGTNSFRPIITIEETNSEGTVLEDAGQNMVMSCPFDCKFRPESLSMDITTISGRSLSLVYENIWSYSIFGTTTGLTTMYSIWNQIAIRSALYL